MELAREGKTLHHCVSTYKEYCIKGLSYIFSFGKRDESHEQKALLTLEVRGNSIVQVRGACNRFPTDSEKEIISIWAQETGLIEQFAL